MDDGGSRPGPPRSRPAAAPKRRRAAFIWILAGGLVGAILVAIIVVSVTGDDPKNAGAKAAHDAGRNLGRPHLSGCDESGCTASGRIQPDAWGGSGAIHVVTTVRFMGAAGGVISRCSDSAMATSKLLVSFSCRTGGSAWRSWYRSHNGRFTIQAITAFDATVNSAQDISHLLLTLTQEQQGAS